MATEKIGWVEQHKAFVKRCAAGHAANPEYIIGMRSGFFDAAHMVDAMRAELEAKPGRMSEARAAKIGVLQQVGDSICAMRDLLPSPPEKAHG